MSLLKPLFVVRIPWPLLLLWWALLLAAAVYVVAAVVAWQLACLAWRVGREQWTRYQLNRSMKEALS